MNTETIARICHEANRAWCQVNGDASQTPWEAADAWQRDAALAGVRFALDNPQAADSAQHEQWMRHKTEEGWVYGPLKDPRRKTHPCLVAFEALPDREQAKDRLFRAIVRALAE